MNQQIEINIDELVLHGFAAGDRRKIGDALELALTQMFKKQNVNEIIHQSADIPSADGGSFSMQTNSKATHVGNAIANSIKTSLKNINKSR